MLQNQVPDILKSALAKPLPGAKAQQKMSSVQRLETGWNTPPEDVKDSAVLLVLSHSGNQVQLPFIKRAEDGRVHGGQIALPGGRKEEQDTSLIQTALRETQEEIGIHVPEENVLGELTPLYIPPSNSLVTPVVAWLPESPSAYQPDAREVARVLEFGLPDLLHPENQKIVEVNAMYAIKMKAPAYVVNGTIIWGATAMIISEFLSVWQQLET